MKRVQDAPRQTAQERNLFEEIFKGLHTTTIDIIEDALVVLLAHHGELAVSAA